jgi:hypothetical protein
MHTTRADAHLQISRRDFLRGALASAVLLALPSCVRGNGGPSVVSANNGREIPLFLGSNSPSQDSLENMRNDVSNLRGLLQRMVEFAERAASYGGLDFSGCRSVSRVALELADDFLSESRTDMDYLTRRWEFVHSQLLDSIRRCRNVLSGTGIGMRSLGQEFGVDLGGI